MKFIKIATSPSGISLYARLTRPNTHTHYSYAFGASVGGSQVIPVDSAFFHNFWLTANHQGRKELSAQQERIFTFISRRNSGYESAHPTSYLESLCKAFSRGNSRLLEISLDFWKDYTQNYVR